MATSEFSTGKTIFVLAIIVGCFAILWPRVFHPIMQNAFSPKPYISNEKNDPSRENVGCCDVVYDYDINNNFFARLCEMVVHRQEMVGVKGAVKVQLQSNFPKENNPGVTQMCREKVLELCHVDVGTILTEDPKNQKYQEAIEEIRSQNVSFCLRRHYEKHENFMKLAQKMRHRRSALNKKQLKTSPHLHPAMRERGFPMATRMQEPFSHKPTKSETLMGARPGPGSHAKMPPPPIIKGGTSTGSMGFIMPIYTVGIVVFFVYTVMKWWKQIRTTAMVLFKRSEDREPIMAAFQMDPEYRKFVLNQDYSKNRSILSYQEYLKLKEKEQKLKSHHSLEEDDRNLMFTAIEGIIAELDDYREKITADDDGRIEESTTVSSQKEEIPEDAIQSTTIQDTPQDTKDIIPTIQDTAQDTKDIIPTITTEDTTMDKQASVAPVEMLRDSLQAQMSLEDSDLLPTIHEDSRFAVVGVETMAVFEPRPPTPGRSPTPTPFGRKSASPSRAQSPAPPGSDPGPMPEEAKPKLAEFVVPEDVPNILLEANIPSESQFTISESLSETLSAENDDEGEDTDVEEEQPVVIAGKMTISLIDMQANHVDSTPGSSTPPSPGGIRNLQGDSDLLEQSNLGELDFTIQAKDGQILNTLDISSLEKLDGSFLTPAAASEETVYLEEISTVEETIVTTTTEEQRIDNKDKIEKDNKKKEEEEESEEETEEEESDDDDQ